MKILKKVEITRLVERIKIGDIKAVESLYKLLSNKLFLLGLRYFDTKEEVEDLMQEFWLNIFDYCKKMKYSLNAYSYLLKVYENLAKMKLRSPNFTNRPISLELVNQYENMFDNVELTVEQRHLKRSFLKAQSTMTDLEKNVFILVCYEELSIREISKRLNLSKSNVHRIKQSAFNKLKNTLIEDGWGSNE